MSLEQIRSALVTEFQTLLLGVPVVWENTEYTPAGNQAFVRFNHAPEGQTIIEPGDKGAQSHTGALELTVYIPLNEGTAQLYTLQDKIEDMITVREWLDFTDVSVRATGLEELAGGRQGSFFAQSFRLAYEALFARFASTTPFLVTDTDVDVTSTTHFVTDTTK